MLEIAPTQVQDVMLVYIYLSIYLVTIVSDHHHSETLYSSLAAYRESDSSVTICIPFSSDSSYSQEHIRFQQKLLP